MLYLGWIVAAFLSGAVLAYWLLQRKKPTTLRERFSQIDSFCGMSCTSIQEAVAISPQRITRKASG